MESAENSILTADDWFEQLIENIKDNPGIVESTKKRILELLECDG